MVARPIALSLSVAAVLCMTCVLSARAAPVRSPDRDRVLDRERVEVRRRLFVPFRRRFRTPQPPRLVFPPPDDVVPPLIEGAPPIQAVPVEPGFLPHGFTLTLPVAYGARAAVLSPLRRFVEVGQALRACWDPPATLTPSDWRDITLRVSFKRDGSVNGIPRIPYVGAANAVIGSTLRDSLTAALRACTPLAFSPSLGAAVAGEIFAIRFTNGNPR